MALADKDAAKLSYAAFVLVAFIAHLAHHVADNHDVDPHH